MTRKHSTRLSQAHDEDPEDSGQHTAAHWYPELGTILDDRPDPGRQITVIGSKTAAAYGTEDDARNTDYNGGEGDLGMDWAEPANQDWVHENVGPQEEAPPPPWAMSPVMARLFELEEAAGFFGREATTVNGTQVDDAGDAPEHGTIPRAEDPNAYDDASDEGGGDDKWNEALPWGDKKNENAATVGMYPEGISSGNGPGISVGPFTAELREWEQHPDLTILHGTWITREGLADHLRAFHGMDFDPGRRSASEMRGAHTWHHMTHPDYEGGSHPLHWSPEFDDDDDEENSAPQYGRLQAPGEDEPDYGTAAHYQAHEGPIDPVFGSLHEARVPWTGEERGRLHRWQEEPTASWGDFVNSAEFLDSPAERSNVRHEEDGEGIGVVEATSDRQWELHLRRDHGWDDASFQRQRQQGNQLRDMHAALHEAGLANHKHPGGPEQAKDEIRAREVTDRFGPESGMPPAWRALTTDRRGGSSRTDPYDRLVSAEPAKAIDINQFQQTDPARFKRMMSALDPPHAHDDDTSYLDAGPAEGDELFRTPHSDAESPWRTAALNVHVRIDGQELKQHEHDDEDNSLDHDKDKTPDKTLDKNGPETGSSQVDDDDSLDSPADIPGPGKPGGKSSAPADAGGFPPGHPMSDPANWPSAGAGVNERERAYTQGSDDGKVKRGAPAPDSFSPDDGDSGGGGDQGDDQGDGDQPDDDSTPFSKDAALGMFAAAAGNREFRFEFTATWHDVMAKAKRIRAEGHVRITHASAGMVIGEVRGDHDIYESGIQRPVGKRSAIQHWACGCPWASYHQDKSYGGRYAGRPCSHVMALQFEAQSRGMFGRPFDADGEPAPWSPPTVVVKSMPPYEGEPHRGRWREQWRAPLAHLEHDGAPCQRATAVLARAGADRDEIGALRLLAGLRATADQANAPWGSDNVSEHPAQKPYGATSPPDKDTDPGSYGPLSAPDPANWGGIDQDSAFQMPLTNTAAHQVLVPGAPRPVPGDVDWPGTAGWQQEDQGTFGFTDQAPTAGPSTAMNPRDPQGIRMEETLASGTPYPFRDTVPQLDGALAELHDRPEPALPSTTGEEEIEATAAADSTIGGGSAGTGEGVGAPLDTAALGEFGASYREASAMGDQGIAEGLSGGGQDPSPVGQEPGMGSSDEYLTPDDQSIQTIGNQQWSGGGADSDEVAVPAGQPQGGIDDIVAAFQRSAAARGYSGASPARSDGDIALAARQYLTKTADVLPQAEAEELIREGRGERARNLNLLRLEGTHYEEEDSDLARRGISMDDYDDDVISA